MRLTEAYDYYYWYLFQPWTMARIFNECLGDFEPRSSVGNRYEFQARLSKSLVIRIYHSYELNSGQVKKVYRWTFNKEIWIEDYSNNRTCLLFSQKLIPYGDLIVEPLEGRRSLIFILNKIHNGDFPLLTTRLQAEYCYRLRSKVRRLCL